MKHSSKLTEGPILKSLLSLAGPIVLTNLMHTAYQLVDTFWVGKLGASAVAAVSLSFPIIFLLISLGVGFSMAGTILVAQYFGQKNTKQVNHVASQTVSLMFLISVPLAVLGYYSAQPIMELMGAKGDVLPNAISYLKVSSIGIIFMFSFFVFQSLMRGAGETKMPLYIVTSTVLLNLILDPFFIMGFGSFPGYGVTGAAVATILTEALASIIGLAILFRGKHKIKIQLQHFIPNLKLVRKMFLLGLPASIEQSMKALGLIILSFLVATFDTFIIAAYGIGIRIITFVIIPAFGLSMATSTLVGQNIGANKTNRAEKIANTSLKIGFSTLLILGVLSFVFSNLLASIFIPGDPLAISEATTYIKFISFGFPLIGAYLIINGILQGAGDTRIPMLFSIISLWVLEFPISYILSTHTNLNQTGLWIAMPVTNLILALAGFLYFKSGNWKNIKLIGNPNAELEQKIAIETKIEEGR